jgi:hypothetical protein
MRSHFLGGLAALAMVAAVFTASQTRADAPPAAPASDSQELARIILANTGTTFFLYRSFWLDKALDGPAISRPAWPAMLREVAAATIIERIPHLEAMLSDRLAANFTPAELAAGLKVLRTPQGQAAIAKGVPVALLHGDVGSLDGLMTTPQGHAFVAHLSKTPEFITPVWREAEAEIVPETLRRFGEKAQAAETPLSPIEAASPGATHLAHVFCETSDFPDAIDESVRNELFYGLVRSSPEWEPVFHEEMNAALKAQSPQVEGRIAVEFDHDLSPGALAKGEAFIETPAGRAAFEQAAGNWYPSIHIPLKPDVQVEVDRFRATPDGQAFLAELDKAMTDLREMSDDVEMRAYPPALRRFGERIEAAHAGGH